MAEYIVNTTDGICNARTTGEIIRCRNCVNAKPRKSDGFFVCEFWTAFACDSGQILVPPDGFCHNAEVEDDGE